MNIIPVIDIKEGHVVSARQGQRDSYQPVKSHLCKQSDVEYVFNQFLNIYPFKRFYIADIDAITNRGSNHLLIETLLDHFPNIDFWVDKGLKIKEKDNLIKRNYRPIIGTENQVNEEISLQALTNTVLSLDFFPNQGFKGPKWILENPHAWPTEVIIMNLACVGKNAGPDFEKLNQFVQKFPGKNFIAAGGIRNETDLFKLEKAGVNSALIASALHSGCITTHTIEKFKTEKCPTRAGHFIKQNGSNR